MKAQGGKPAFRRRNYFIDKGFQARFILKFLMVVIPSSALSGYVMYLIISREVEDTFYRTHISLSSTGQLVLPAMLKVNSAMLLVVLPVVAILTLLISHKVAGPLLRLGKAAERIGDGDFSGGFALRSMDELKALAGSLEDMNGKLKERFGLLRDRAEKIGRAAGTMHGYYAHCISSGAGVDSRAEAEGLRELRALADSLGAELARFRVDRPAR